MVREGTEEQLVEDTSLVDIQVICDLAITPGRKVARRIVSSVEAIPTSQADGIGKDHT